MSGDGSDSEGMASSEREAEEDPLQIIVRQQRELQAAMMALTVALQTTADRWAAAPPPPRPATPPVVSFGAADNNPFTPSFNDPVAHPRIPVVHASVSPQSPPLQPHIIRVHIPSPPDPLDNPPEDPLDDPRTPLLRPFDTHLHGNNCIEGKCFNLRPDARPAYPPVEQPPMPASPRDTPPSHDQPPRRTNPPCVGSKRVNSFRWYS
jgi:hypothetical protein